MLDQLLPTALDTYKALEKELDCPLISQYSILDFHETDEAENLFLKRAAEEKEYLHIPAAQDEWKPYFHFAHGVGEIAPCWLIDIHTLLAKWRNKLHQDNALLEEKFDWEKCIVGEDRVVYKDITAKKIICCEGAGGVDNPYFSSMPYRKNKGEVIIASIPGLPQTHLYKQEFKIAPWEEDLFWIGSSFEWKYNDLEPTDTFRKKVETALQQWLKLPYAIIDQWASERPATTDYKPFAGLHPAYNTMAILNGMGSKGCSLAPCFAKQLTELIISC